MYIYNLNQMDATANPAVSPRVGLPRTPSAEALRAATKPVGLPLRGFWGVHFFLFFSRIGPFHGVTFVGTHPKKKQKRGDLCGNPPKEKQKSMTFTSEKLLLLRMNEIRSHHFETIMFVGICGESSFQGFLGGAGFHPSTVVITFPT